MEQEEEIKIEEKGKDSVLRKSKDKKK